MELEIHNLKIIIINLLNESTTPLAIKYFVVQEILNELTSLRQETLIAEQNKIKQENEELKDL